MTPPLPWWRTWLIALLRRLHAVITAWLARLESPTGDPGRSVLDEEAPPAHWLAHIRATAPQASFVSRAAPGVEESQAPQEEVPPPPAAWLAHVQAVRARAQARTSPPRDGQWWRVLAKVGSWIRRPSGSTRPVAGDPWDAGSVASLPVVTPRSVVDVRASPSLGREGQVMPSSLVASRAREPSSQSQSVPSRMGWWPRLQEVIGIRRRGGSPQRATPARIAPASYAAYPSRDEIRSGASEDEDAPPPPTAWLTHVQEIRAQVQARTRAPRRGGWQRFLAGLASLMRPLVLVVVSVGTAWYRRGTSRNTVPTASLPVTATAMSPASSPSHHPPSTAVTAGRSRWLAGIRAWPRRSSHVPVVASEVLPSPPVQDSVAAVPRGPRALPSSSEALAARVQADSAAMAAHKPVASPSSDFPASHGLVDSIDGGPSSTVSETRSARDVVVLPTARPRSVVLVAGPAGAFVRRDLAHPQAVPSAGRSSHGQSAMLERSGITPHPLSPAEERSATCSPGAPLAQHGDGVASERNRSSPEVTTALPPSPQVAPAGQASRGIVWTWVASWVVVLGRVLARVATRHVQPGPERGLGPSAPMAEPQVDEPARPWCRTSRMTSPLPSPGAPPAQRPSPASIAAGEDPRSAAHPALVSSPDFLPLVSSSAVSSRTASVSETLMTMGDDQPLARLAPLLATNPVLPAMAPTAPASTTPGRHRPVVRIAERPSPDSLPMTVPAVDVPRSFVVSPVSVVASRHHGPVTQLDQTLPSRPSLALDPERLPVPTGAGLVPSPLRSSHSMAASVPPGMAAGGDPASDSVPPSRGRWWGVAWFRRLMGLAKTAGLALPRNDRQHTVRASTSTRGTVEKSMDAPESAPPSARPWLHPAGDLPRSWWRRGGPEAVPHPPSSPVARGDGDVPTEESRFTPSPASPSDKALFVPAPSHWPSLMDDALVDGLDGTLADPQGERHRAPAPAAWDRALSQAAAPVLDVTGQPRLAGGFAPRHLGCSSPPRSVPHPWPSLADEADDDLTPQGIPSLTDVSDDPGPGGWPWNG
jgi:hypothetical protein